MDTRDAGRMGGRKTAKKYGPEFYKKISKKGVAARNALLEAGKKALAQKKADK